MSVFQAHFSPFSFPFLWEYWEYDKLPVHQPAEFLWGEGSIALELPHGNWGDNIWRRLFITEEMLCSYRCTSCIFIVYLFYPLPALVCCCMCNSNEIWIFMKEITVTYCLCPYILVILLCFCMKLQLTHCLPGCMEGSWAVQWWSLRHLGHSVVCITHGSRFPGGHLNLGLVWQ